LAQQIMQANQMSQQYGIPPFPMDQVMQMFQKVTVVPDNEYQKGVDAGDYVGPEQLGVKI